jgi:DNA-binding NtrC family response regulator
MSREKVLIVEDEQNERNGLAELVSSWGYVADTARDGLEGYEKVSVWSPAIVITDLKMPRMSGLELLEKIAAESQTIAVIVVTAQGTIDSAVQAMRMGAYDYVTKPIDTSRLRTILQNASALLGARVELSHAPQAARCWFADRWLARSKKMQEILRLTGTGRPSTASVLITGASGMEGAGRATIHEPEPAALETFVAINCAAIPRLDGGKFSATKGRVHRSYGAPHRMLQLAEGGTLRSMKSSEMPSARRPNSTGSEDYKLR